MAAVPRPSAQTRWPSVNVPRMIVLVRAPGVDDGKAVPAHNRPEADRRGAATTRWVPYITDEVAL
jgi:hypothetical protein